jgi:acetyl esterase/lipase
LHFCFWFRQLAVLAKPRTKAIRSAVTPRLKKEVPEGQRDKLSIGTLFLPKGVKGAGKMPLFIHFHGGDWLPEAAARDHANTAVLSVQLGSGSAVYAKPFADAKSFGNLLAEAEKKAGVKFGPITLTAWSAGYGAVRAILKNPGDYARIDGVVLLDGMHAGYVKDPTAKGPAKIVPEHVDIFVQFASDAVAEKKRFIVTHTQIVPPGYASNTETADYLLHHLKLERKESKKIGPMQTQQLSEARAGHFVLLGYEGDTAADHVDLLHALPYYLKLVHAVE